MRKFYANDYRTDINHPLFKNKIIFTNILSYLNFEDISRASRTCRSFRQLSRECLTVIRCDEFCAVTPLMLRNLLMHYGGNGNITAICPNFPKLDKLLIGGTLSNIADYPIYCNNVIYYIDVGKEDIEDFCRLIRYCVKLVDEHSNANLSIQRMVNKTSFEESNVLIAFYGDRHIRVNPPLIGSKWEDRSGRLKKEEVISTGIESIVSLLSRGKSMNVDEIIPYIGELKKLHVLSPKAFKLDTVISSLRSYLDIWTLLNIHKLKNNYCKLDEINEHYLLTLAKVGTYVNKLKVPKFLKEIHIHCYEADNINLELIVAILEAKPRINLHIEFTCTNQDLKVDTDDPLDNNSSYGSNVTGLTDHLSILKKLYHNLSGWAYSKMILSRYF